MYLSVHAAIGGAIGQYTGNPLLAVAAGFASHLALDVIPHGDSAKSGMPQTKRATLVAAAVDLSVLCGIMMLLWHTYGLQFFSPLVVAGAIGGMIPDILQAPFLLSDGKYFNRYHRFHNFFHNAIVARWDFPAPLGICLQAALLIGTLVYAF